MSLLHKLETTPLFSETDAWNLYRLVALAEAVGWSLLLIGLGLRHFNLPGHSIAVPIAGQIHGMIFLTYFAVLLAAYSSLRWSRSKFLMALIAGVPPFGSLLFERWAAYRRDYQLGQRQISQLVLTIVRQQSRVTDN